MKPSACPVVRAAEPADFPAIRDLTLAVYLGEGLAGESYADALADVAARAAEAELLVAVDADGAVVGSVALAWHGSSYAEITCGPEEAAFRMLAVHPAARGRGVGRALVVACLDQAGQAGIRRMVICSASAMRAAHRLYGELGFRRAPERDWSPEPDVELRCYTLELG